VGHTKRVARLNELLSGITLEGALDEETEILDHVTITANNVHFCEIRWWRVRNHVPINLPCSDGLVNLRVVVGTHVMKSKNLLRG